MIYSEVTVVLLHLACRRACGQPYTSGFQQTEMPVTVSALAFHFHELKGKYSLICI